MLQDDSNGDSSSFEIVSGKNQVNNDKSESSSTLSAVSSAYSMTSPSGLSLTGGNLLSNVQPPSSLPDFTLWPSPVSADTQPSIVPVTSSNQTISVQPQVSVISNTNVMQQLSDQFPSTQFSAAIPPSKGIQHGPALQVRTDPSESTGGGFMGMVKEAFSSGGVLSKMAEKAKNSVDSIITTLDPQMSEYIYSSGDLEITVASENDEEVGAIRDAFHAVVGKAWINGIKLNLPSKEKQAVGFAAGIKNAEAKLECSLKYRKTPTISIESILLQQDEEWYDLSILILKDAEKQITVKTFSQTTPVPVDQFLKNFENERPDAKLLNTEEKLALYLQAIPGWQLEISGVSRRESLLLAAKTLARTYKNKVASL